MHRSDAMGEDKQARYAALVEARKSCDACKALTNPSLAGGGLFDSDRIGPYSRWQGNLDAELLVVAQVFSDVENFESELGWPGDEVFLNHKIVEFARAAGIDISPPKHGHSEDRLFFTNGVLCLTRGGRQVRVSRQCFRTCGRLFLRSTIDIVRPIAIAALGVDALDAVRAAFGLESDRRLLRDLVGSSFDLPNGTAVFPLYLPSPLVINRGTRSLEQQVSDWALMGRWLKEKRATDPSGTIVEFSA